MRVEDGCGDEQTKSLCPVVHEYWKYVHDGKTLHGCKFNDVCSVKLPAGMGFEKTQPWSAAFISVIFARAKFSKEEFLPGRSHAEYIFAARERYASAYDVVPLPLRPQVGDLICANRVDRVKDPDAVPLTPGEIHRIRRNWPTMHCDIVVEVDMQNLMVHAIGGNVQQTVARTLVPLDAQGLVQYNATSGAPWMLVMRARRTEALPSVPLSNPG